MSWFIDANVNGGYPSNTGFPETYPATWSAPYNPRTWRIMAGVNDGYPFLGVWFDVSPEGSGDMDIGGSQTNYPNGFTTSDTGGIDDQFNDNDMGFNTDLIDDINDVFKSALNEKILGLSTADFQRIVGYLNDPFRTMGPNYDPSMIQKMYGANIYDGVLLCKMYPFDLTGSFPPTCYPSIFGIYRLYSVAENPPGSGNYEPIEGTEVPKVSDVVRGFHMGSLSLDIFQAWEVENISYSIFLPCAGVFPLDIRDGSEVSVVLFVDILSGIGEYTIKQNGQVTGIHKISIGVDVPINLTQGQVASNHSAFISSQIARVASMAAPMIGAVNPVAGMVAGAGASALGAMSGQMGGHLDVSSPSVGESVGMASYPYARIIAKIPKMFNGGYGYRETLGENRSTTYTTLSTCSGFVQCKNYKSDIIVATEEEKREIEALMNQGVFI